MLHTFRQPYPVFLNQKQRILASLLVGIFVALFLSLFQPFGLYNWQHPQKVLLLTGYGFISGILMLVWELLKINYIKKQEEEKWTVGKEITTILLLLISIGIANWLYSSTIGFTNFTPASFFGYLAMTFLVGIFPSVFIPLLNYMLKLQRHTRTSQQLNKQLRVPSHNPPPEEKLITLTAENEKDSFTCLSHHLYSITSADNYAVLLYQNPESFKLEKQLLRSSLSRLEEQLVNSTIKRCHRSHLANLALVKGVSGNAQGYQLHFPHNIPSLPLSRKYAAEVLSWLQNKNKLQTR